LSDGRRDQLAILSHVAEISSSGFAWHFGHAADFRDLEEAWDSWRRFSMKMRTILTSEMIFVLTVVHCDLTSMAALSIGYLVAVKEATIPFAQRGSMFKIQPEIHRAKTNRMVRYVVGHGYPGAG
jgi:hypothetical protein